DIISFLSQYLSYGALDLSLAHEGAHAPRLTLDNLVVNRERWMFSASAMPFLELEEAIERFAGARRFKEEHSLPRFVFVKVPEEKKPFYLDFESPTLVDIWMRRAKKAAWIAMSEMLPSSEQLWLVDARGEKYTSELRMAAVDALHYEED